MTIDLTGKTVLITGGTGGIGRVTARELARMGAQVVITGRNSEQAAETVAEIQHSTGNPHVAALLGDLSVQADVRRLAEAFRQRYDRLDVLINNAGAVFFRRQVTVEGFEMTLALNHLAPFLLTNLLLDLLQSSSPARIINVSSSAHRGARLNLEDLNNSQRYMGWWVYCQSKLMNILFTNELARRLGSSVTANSLHPGFVATNFGRSNRGILGLLWSAIDLAAISPERGAQTSIYLASSPEVAGISGGYFEDCKPRRADPAAYDAELARRLWDASRAMTGVG